MEPMSSLRNSRSVFAVPLPDRPVNLLEAIDYHGVKNPQYPLFRYEEIDSTIRTINWGQALHAFDISARFILQSTTSETPSTNNVQPKVIGILANLDTMTYYALIIGIMKAGFTPFPISIRNSAEAVAHLMAGTDCHVLYITEDSTTHQLAVSAFKMFENTGLTKSAPTMITAPTFEQLYSGKVAFESSESKIPARTIGDESSTPCVILHSSGTVSFPKPITLTYQAIIQHATIHRYEGDLGGRVLAAHAVPLYHLMGFSLIPWSTILGITISVFRPTRPAIVPSPDFVLRNAVATRSSLIFCASSFLENWVVDPSNVESLKKFDKIMFGGGPLQVSIGDSLVKQGVKLVPLLGLTEVGIITNFFPKHIQSEGWSWYEADARIDVILIPEDKENGTFRLAIKENSVKIPAIFNTVIDGVRAFDTKDLVMMHPTNPRLWRIYGRADEQIMHSTGEKTNPVPIEAMLSKSPYVSAALMFGRARFQPGVIITPALDYAFDFSNPKNVHDYVELVWDAVAAANQQSPQHSKIFKEMILIADPRRPFEYTVKGTLRRKFTLSKYERDIEQLYENADAEVAFEHQTPRSREPTDITSFIRSVVQSTLGQKLEDEDNIFKIGADSLCALSIRNSITRGFRQSGSLSSSAVEALPRDFVYTLPSIAMMSAFFSGAVLVDGLKTRSLPGAALEVLDTSAGGKQASETDGQETTLDLKWQSILESKETVVEIAAGHGEPPFIILHGAPGSTETFRCFMKYTSAVWSIQVVDDTPQDSIEGAVAFYYAKIREKQPHGPYRLASYSGSSVLLIELVSLVERSGETVIQFAMIDHFPTFFFPNFQPDDVRLNSPEWMDKYIRACMDRILLALEPALDSPMIQQRYQELKDSMNGLPGTPGSRRYIQRTTDMHRMALKYMMRDAFLESNSGSDGERKTWSASLFRNYVARIRARLTVYIARDGLRTMVSDEQQKVDLGARAFFRDAEIVAIGGDHLSCLYDEELRRSIEGEYYVQ